MVLSHKGHPRNGADEATATGGEWVMSHAL